jgi:hypothetical protein
MISGRVGRFGARTGESVAKVVPERDFELGPGIGEAEKGTAAVTTDRCGCTAATLAAEAGLKQPAEIPAVFKGHLP